MRRMSLTIAAVASVLVAAACSEEPLCPFPEATAVEITPATACLTANVETCIEPTLIVKDGCPTPLYLPTEYGRFGPDGAVGADIELLAGQSVRYVVRDEKAVSRSGDRKEYVIPARLGTDKIEFKFATLAAK